MCGTKINQYIGLNFLGTDYYAVLFQYSELRSDVFVHVAPSETESLTIMVGFSARALICFWHLKGEHLFETGSLFGRGHLIILF